MLSDAGGPWSNLSEVEYMYICDVQGDSTLLPRSLSVVSQVLLLFLMPKRHCGTAQIGDFLSAGAMQDACPLFQASLVLTHLVIV